jgi:hypothetical protein
MLPMAHGSVAWNSINPVPWLRPLATYYSTTNVLISPALCLAYNKSHCSLHRKVGMSSAGAVGGYWICSQTVFK